MLESQSQIYKVNTKLSLILYFCCLYPNNLVPFHYTYSCEFCSTICTFRKVCLGTRKIDKIIIMVGDKVLISEEVEYLLKPSRYSDKRK